MLNYQFGKFVYSKKWFTCLLCMFVLCTCVRQDASDYPDPFSKEQCSAYINEINFAASQDTFQFVEIMIKCKTLLSNCLTVDMSHFLLIFMNPRGHMVGVCQLTGMLHVQPFSESYYTIGKQNNYSPFNLDIDNCVLTHFGKFPQGHTEPYGLALTYISNSSKEYYRENLFPLVMHFGNVMYETVITADVEDMIIAQIQDFIIYASITAKTFCNYYQRYFYGYSLSENPTLRDWNVQSSKDRSISRCTESFLPFQATKMKYSSLTPGKPNACSTAFSHNFHKFKSINTLQKALFSNDSSGCYSFNYNSSVEFKDHLLSSATTYFEELDTLESLLAPAPTNSTYSVNILGVTHYFNNLTNECVLISEWDVNDKDSDTSMTYEPSDRSKLTESCLTCQTCIKGKYIYNYFLNDIDNHQVISTPSRRRRHKYIELCKTQFSELNSMSPFTDSDEFIEIRRICGPKGFVKNSKYVLDEHILFFIEILETPQIRFIADLGGLPLLPKINKYSSNKIYIGTLGSKQYSSETWIFQNRHGVQYSSTDTNNIIPDGTNSVVLGILLFTKGATRPHNTFQLSKDPTTQEYQPLLLTQDMKNLIKLYAVDIIAYASNPKYSNCEIIHQLSNQFSSKNYILRDWNQRGAGTQDHSIGRCGTEIQSFSPQSFKIGIPTPNAVNDCETSVAFLLDRELNDIAPFLSSTVNVETEDLISCTSSKQPNPISAVSSVDYINAIESKRAKYEFSMMQINEPSPLPNVLENLPGLDKYVRDWKEEVERNPQRETKRPWESDKYYDEAWTEHVRRAMSDKLDPQLISRPDIKTWIQLLPNSINNQWRYNCRLCSQFFDKNNRLDRRGTMRQKPIMETNGVLEVGKGAFLKNSKNIQEHLFSEIHFQAVEYLQERHINMFEENANVPKKDKYFVTTIQDEYFRSTINVFRIVFFRIKYNIPCNVYPSMIDLFKFFDVNVGHKHYDEKNCGLITRHIGAEIHKRLVQHLIKNKKPFTVLIDAASVGPKHHFLLFMIRCLENGEPVTYIYRLIEIGSKSTAEGTWEAMKLAIELDGNEFETFFKAQAVGFASDGASVNLGIRNSIMTRFKAYLHSKIPVFHCISHKNQLIYRNVVTRKNAIGLYVRKLESVLNHLHSFYSIKSYKRNANLREFVSQMNKVAKEKEETTSQPIKYIQLKRIYGQHRRQKF